MGDVEELKYDQLYTKAIVLRHKMKMIQSAGIGEKSKMIGVLKTLKEEIAELNSEILSLFSKKVQDV